MDEYRIDTNELWYYILYPIILVASLGTLVGFETLIAKCIQYLAPSTNTGLTHGLSIGILMGIIPVILALYKIGIGVKETPFSTIQFLGAIGVATAIYIIIVNLNNFFYPVYNSLRNATTTLVSNQLISSTFPMKINKDQATLTDAIAAVAAAQAIVDTDLAGLSKTIPNNSNPAYSDYTFAINYQTLLEAARTSKINPTKAVYTASANVSIPNSASVKTAFADILKLVITEIEQDNAQATLTRDKAMLAAATTAIPVDKVMLHSAIIQSKLYEPVTETFTDGSTINQTLKNVQQTTQSLQSSLDTLSAATDDTCSVMKGIETKFLDNSTAPEGDDGTPPSPAEAKALKAQKLPGAKKQWTEKKQDWSATHGQVSMIECFADGSLSELVGANQQLSDLLASAPVQRVVGQIKSIQTSSLFAQSYIDQLVANLTGESFDNPTSEDTIAISNKLIAQAKDVQVKIRGILDSTKILKKNYSVIIAKSNDPNTVNDIAGKKV